MMIISAMMLMADCWWLLWLRTESASEC